MSKIHSILSMSDEAFGWYFTGLVDGEGSFILAGKADRNKKHQYWTASLKITLRADETAHLCAIAERLGCGSLYKYRRPCGGIGNPYTSWEVFRREPLATIIVPHFLRFPLQLKKAKDFAAWMPCVTLIHEISQRPYNGTGSHLGRTKMLSGEHDFILRSAHHLKLLRLYSGPPAAEYPTRMPRVRIKRSPEALGE
jgi:hypothetical protein